MQRKSVRIKTPGYGTTKVSYRECGTGQAILLVHGWTSSADAWDEIIPLLPGRIIALDLPGFGCSPPLGGAHTIGVFAEVLKKFLDALKLRGKVIVVGHSMGATVALVFAMRYPARVRGLVPVGPLLCGEDFAVTERIEAAWYRASAATFPTLFELFGKMVLVASVATRMFNPKDATRLLARLSPHRWTVALRDFCAFSGRAAIEIIEDLMRIDLREGLSQLSMPVLWVDGREVIYRPIATAHYATLVPGLTETFLIPESGHVAPLTHPEEFVDHIRELLMRIRCRKRP